MYSDDFCVVSICDFCKKRVYFFERMCRHGVGGGLGVSVPAFCQPAIFLAFIKNLAAIVC